MTLDRDEAKSALAEIGQAQGKVDRVHWYSDAAPFFVLWGVIWLLANLVTEFRPAWSNWAWLIGALVGTPATAYFSIVQARRRGARIRQAGGDPGDISIRSAFTMGAILVFLAGSIAVTGPLEERQGNALISLFWACIYMGVGAWVGMRLMLIGAATAAIILAAYFTLDQYYFLVMGLAAGGSLILGGLWLRKI